VSAEFRHVDDAEAQRANRADWDREADAYQRAHGAFLGNARFVWSPEGLDEADAHLLGEVRGRRVLDLGCGAAQCARWLRSEGAVAFGIDLSLRQLQHARRIDEETSIGVPTVCGSATRLPFADASFDLVASAFGALPFVVDVAGALREVRRVTCAGGAAVFSVVHPVRRMFPDDPTETGKTISRSYFDRSAYVESEPDGRPGYVEPHHTLGDWVAAIHDAGLVLEQLVEPEWPRGHTRVWGGWGPIRSALLPGTAIFVTMAAI
jgi:SAM-dependent methyltransferase